MDQQLVVNFRAARWLHQTAINNSTNTTNLTCDPLLETAKVEGNWIPLVFGINIGVAALILCLFAVLNCFCKDFVRIAYFRNYQRWPPLLKGVDRFWDEKKGEEEEIDEDGPVKISRRRGSSIHRGRNCWHRLWRYLTMGEGGVRERCGPDAALYLTMQLHLIALLVIYTTLSLTIILPTNYFLGNLKTNGFSKTTIGNLNPENSILWLHVIMAIVYLAVAGLFMVHYSLRLGRNQNFFSNHTVQIQHIPHLVHVEDLMQHMEDIMPGAHIIDVRFAYDVSELTKTWSKLKTAMRHLEAAESYELEKGQKKYIRQGCCNRELVDAKEYYNEEQKRLKVAVMLKSSGALVNKLHIAYVSFTNEEDAQKFIRSYRFPCCRPQSILSDSINSSWWSVSLAPLSSDIIWENLSTPKSLWWFRWIIINLSLLILIFFFTTPTILLATIDEISVALANITTINKLVKEQNFTFQTPPIIQNFFSAFLLWLLRAVMVLLVVKSCFLEAHWSRSSREKSILRKLYIFQLLMIVTLPSMGLTSLNAIAQLVFQSKGGEILLKKLACTYLPNNGAFFITYILIAIFISNPIELVRLPELCEYLFFRLLAKTRVEKDHALKRVARYEFMFGVQYANCLLIFAMTMTFSLSCPIIVPCGLVYFLFKYFIDKYNLLYAYQNISASGRQYFHQTALRFVIISLISLQLATLFFTLVRGDGLTARGIFLIVSLVLTTVICFGILILGWFSFLLPWLQVKALGIFGNPPGTEIPEPGSYIPSVLRESTDENLNLSEPSSVASSYESFGRKLAKGTAMDDNRGTRVSSKRNRQEARDSVLYHVKEEENEQERSIN